MAGAASTDGRREYAYLIWQERLQLMAEERMPGVWGKSSMLLALTHLSPRADSTADTLKLAAEVATQVTLGFGLG